MHRGGSVKDDTGCKAAGSSASQVTAAKVWDTISRLAGVAGEANAADSACTQGKLKDSVKLLELPATECPTIRRRPPRDRCTANWDTVDAAVLFMEVVDLPVWQVVKEILDCRVDPEMLDEAPSPPSTGPWHSGTILPGLAQPCLPRVLHASVLDQDYPGHLSTLAAQEWDYLSTPPRPESTRPTL